MQLYSSILTAAVCLFEQKSGQQAHEKGRVLCLRSSWSNGTSHQMKDKIRTDDPGVAKQSVTHFVSFLSRGVGHGRGKLC